MYVIQFYGFLNAPNGFFRKRFPKTIRDFSRQGWRERVLKIVGVLIQVTDFFFWRSWGGLNCHEISALPTVLLRNRRCLHNNHHRHPHIGTLFMCVISINRNVFIYPLPSSLSSLPLISLGSLWSMDDSVWGSWALLVKQTSDRGQKSHLQLKSHTNSHITKSLTSS